MAGQSSNLGASSSSRPRKQKGTKREQNATHGDEPKKQRRHSQPSVTAAAHPNAGASAVPVVPLHYAASRSAAMAVTTFPVAGVNGAALRWHTAAALAAATTTRAPVWSLPVIASTTNGNAAAGQLVSVQLPLISYKQAMAGGVSSSPAPAMAAALANIRSDTLGRLLSAVMRSCNPPQLQSWTGAPPPWWPSPAAEDMSDLTPVPFAPPYKLRKEEKVAVLVAIVKHHAPDLAVFSTDAMCERAKLSNDPEAANWWRCALAIEAGRHNPKPPAMVVNLIMAPPHATGDGHLPAATGAADPATEDGVMHGGGGNGGEQGVMVAGGDSVTALGDDGGHGLVVAAAEPEQKQEELSNGVLDGGDGDVDRPVNFLGDDFASADMDQLLDDMLAPFQMQQQIEEAHQIEAMDVEVEAPGVAAAVEEEAAQGEGPWYMEEDMANFFEDFEPLRDENGKNYLDYFDL